MYSVLAEQNQDKFDVQLTRYGHYMTRSLVPRTKLDAIKVAVNWQFDPANEHLVRDGYKAEVVPYV